MRAPEQIAVREERTRIAREIHDNAAQAFAGILLHSEVLSGSLPLTQARRKKSLSQIRKLARSGLDEARRSVQALHSEAMEGAALSEALAQAAKRLAFDANVPCDFKLRGKSFKLPLLLQNELFKIAQEALNNVKLHGDARAIRMGLKFLAGQVILTIEDQGRGIATAIFDRGNSGSGLAAMRERVHHLGGQLRIETPGGGGARFSVSVPVPQKQRRSGHAT